jgi:CubicO group peptidase (beta-lactamase class C family)
MKINISDKLQEFHDFLLEIMKEWNVPGMAVGVVKDGETIYSGELGLRNVKQNLEVTKDTLFAIGSATKAFTSTAIGILVDEGKLNLDTPIKKYVPDFEMQDKYAGEHLTIRDMLCHRSGLPRHDMVWYNNSSLSRKDLMGRIKHLELSKDFRSTWQYNNIMYAAVGHIIEVVSGMSYEEFVKTRIFQPLGMDSSNFSVEDSKCSVDYSLPYLSKGKEVSEINFRNMDLMGPAGSINSNLMDMIKWLKFHLNKGKANGKQIISESSITQIHSPQIPCELWPWKFDEIQFSSYGLGWFIDSYRGKKQVNHGGNIDGFSSYISFLPEENLGIVILSNLNEGFFTLPLSYFIYDKLLGYEHTDWSKRMKSEVSKMMNSIESVNIAAKKSQKQDTKLSHQVEEFTGSFENPGYGIIRIKREGESLKLIYNDIEYILKHKCYDVFVMTVMERLVFTVTFNCDSNGDINCVSIPFEQGTKEIKFKGCK